MSTLRRLPLPSLSATLATALLLASSLACGGLLGSKQGTPPRIKPNPDANDRAERARLMKDYHRAEAILKERIKDNPDDHHAHRLLGDVNLTRGQDYKKKWKENLARAYDSYSKAVALQPTNCSYWSRVAGVVTMAYPQEPTWIGPETLMSLPLDKGWEHCAGPALVELDLRRDAALEVVEAYEEENRRASKWDKIAALQPWVPEAWKRAPLGQVNWMEDHAKTPLVGGLPFVVVKPPLDAKGVGHDYNRGVNAIEQFTTGRVSGANVVFTDRRFPKKLPRNAIVKAGACQYSSWRNNDITGVASGSCSTGSYLRSKSALYAPERLTVAGPGHYEFTSIGPAIISGDEILFETVRCLGGKIGRKFEYVPTCPVAYDKPNWLQRSLPASKVLGARSQDHADQMIEAAAMQPIWGDELTERMLRGDIGVGMPYSVFRYAVDKARTCEGRILLNNHLINGGELEWTCLVGDRAFTFVDLQLVWFGTKAEYDAALAPVAKEE